MEEGKVSTQLCLGTNLKCIEVITLILFLLQLPCNEATFSMTVLHTGDLHARFQQTDKYAGLCSIEESNDGQCYGGFARLAQAIKDIRQAEDNVVLLDSGDVFQGTIWFTIYEGKASSFFMNSLQYDVQALGNHEFDRGTEVLADYLKNLNASVVSANIDVSQEAILKDLYTPSVVITVGGERIGVVGYVLPRTRSLSNPGKVLFNEEIDSIQVEVDKLVADGVNKIIALGHSGFPKDQEIAAKVDGIDIVVGGHSSTFLYTGTPPDSNIAVGDYPFLVTSDHDPDIVVPIVHAYDFSKYLGRLHVTFDDNGKLIEYQGNPILLNRDIKRDNDVLAEINEWSKALENVTTNIVGRTHVLLDGTRESCRRKECNFGNMVTDAFLWQTISYPDEERWSDVAIAVMNSGGIRSSVNQGDISLADIYQSLPFGNTVDLLELKGTYIEEMLEHSVALYDVELPGEFLQVSGMWVTYDLSRDVGDRVVDVLVRCTECNIPEFVPLQDDKMYKLALTDFIANGGDGYDVIASHGRNQYSGNTAASVLADYVMIHSPVYPGLERRITFLQPQIEEEPTPEAPTSQPCNTSSTGLSSSTVVIVCLLLFSMTYV